MWLTAANPRSSSGLWILVLFGTRSGCRGHVGDVAGFRLGSMRHTLRSLNTQNAERGQWYRRCILDIGARLYQDLLGHALLSIVDSATVSVSMNGRV